MLVGLTRAIGLPRVSGPWNDAPTCTRNAAAFEPRLASPGRRELLYGFQLKRSALVVRQSHHEGLTLNLSKSEARIDQPETVLPAVGFLRRFLARWFPACFAGHELEPQGVEDGEGAGEPEPEDPREVPHHITSRRKRTPAGPAGQKASVLSSST